MVDAASRRVALAPSKVDLCILLHPTIREHGRSDQAYPACMPMCSYSSGLCLGRIRIFWQENQGCLGIKRQSGHDFIPACAASAQAALRLPGIAVLPDEVWVRRPGSSPSSCRGTRPPCADRRSLWRCVGATWAVARKTNRRNYGGLMILDDCVWARGLPSDLRPQRAVDGSCIVWGCGSFTNLIKSSSRRYSVDRCRALSSDGGQCAPVLGLLGRSCPNIRSRCAASQLLSENGKQRLW